MALISESMSPVKTSLNIMATKTWCPINWRKCDHSVTTNSFTGIPKDRLLICSPRSDFIQSVSLTCSNVTETENVFF